MLGERLVFGKRFLAHLASCCDACAIHLQWAYSWGVGLQALAVQNATAIRLQGRHFSAAWGFQAGQTSGIQGLGAIRSSR